MLRIVAVIRQSETILARSLGTDSRLYHFVIAVWRAKEAESAAVMNWRTALAMFATLSASIALADDFKTINGKEYKNVTVSWGKRLRAPVVRTWNGIWSSATALSRSSALPTHRIQTLFPQVPPESQVAT